MRQHYIPIHDYTGMLKSTNIWITIHKPGTDYWELCFGEPPAHSYYKTKDEKEIEKISGIGIIPEENLSNPPYEFGESFSRIDSTKFPEVLFREIVETEKGPIEKRYLSSKEKWQGDYIIRPSYYNEYGAGIDAQYARFDFWNRDYELVRTELIPIDFLKTPFPLVFADFAYIEEKNIVVFGDHAIDFNEKTITINDTLPTKNYFIEKRTIGGKKLLLIGTDKYVQVYDYDLKRLKAYSISGICVNWFFDEEDNMYVVTSSMLHGADEKRGMKPSDRVKLYKIHISV